MNDKVTYLYDSDKPDWNGRNALAFLGSVIIGAVAVVGLAAVNVWRKMREL